MPLSAVDVFGPGERDRVLTEWNDTAAEVGASSVVELFEAQAARVPDALAVVCEGIELTFAELDARANRLAHHLRALGIGAESAVALCLPRGIDMIAAILGVWKAGAAYLPMDPGYPADRISFMLADSRAAVLVGSRDVLDELPVGRLLTVAVDDPATVAALASRPVTAPQIALAPDQVAYVVYTSGSTGVPKGVAVTHGGLANYVASVPQRVGFGAGRYALLQAQVTDLGNTVVFAALSSGGTLHILSADDAVDAVAVADVISTQHIDFIKAVPSHLAALSSARGPESVLPARSLVLGGEAADPGWVRELVSVAGARGCEVFNHYGPTETTVGVATVRLDAEVLSSRSRPGRNSSREHAVIRARCRDCGRCQRASRGSCTSRARSWLAATSVVRP